MTTAAVPIFCRSHIPNPSHHPDPLGIIQRSPARWTDQTTKLETPLLTPCPSPSSQPVPRNVVVVGETGVGKSSFINLVIGSDNARTTNDVCGVTTHASAHPWETDTHTHAFRLWDTPGLGEASFGSVSHTEAQNALRTLLSQLAQEGGVHLLVLCMRGIARITKGMKQIYDTVLRIRNEVSSQVPIVAVITELEKRCTRANIVGSMEEWWTSNASALAEFDMTFCGHACLTTLSDNSYPSMVGRRAECQRLARNLLIDHSLPFSLAFTRNIVVVGETGAGKSSIINLIIGSDKAVVTSDVHPATVGISYHDWNLLQAQVFRLWDTPGLSSCPSNGALPEHALNALRSLLTELSQSAGVHLLLVCFRGGRHVTMSNKQAYDTILTLRDRACPNTPLVAVITELERKCSPGDDVIVSMDQWWDANIGSMSDFGMTFSGHACITTLADDAHPPVLGRRGKCQRHVRNLINDHALTSNQDLHVVLFGETGVGKSSLVNLLAGRHVADVSPDSVACTLDSTEYQFKLGATTIRLWDTVALREHGEGEENEYIGAIEKAAELIKRLSISGGISLLLFCVRGTRVTTTMQSNYRLFYEVLGRRRVPIALVISHLEREPVMEGWWERNGRTLDDYGIRVGAHACITTLEGHPRCVTSRHAVRELLLKYANQGRFLMPPETWLARLLSGLNALLGFVLPKDKELVRVLTKRCHLEPEVAQRVAACIEAKLDV